MGHCSPIIKVNAKMPKREILKMVRDEVRHQGDRYGTDKITFLPQKFKDLEEAEKFLRSREGELYEGFAVTYNEYQKVDSSKTNVLNERAKKLEEKIGETNLGNMEKWMDRGFVTCKNCGSRVNSSYIELFKCPVCQSELRDLSVLSRIDKLKKQANELRNLAEDSRKDKLVNSYWVVLYTYHE